MFLLPLFHVKFNCIFVQSFPYMFVGFNVRVECENLVKNYEDSEVCNWLTSGRLVKDHVRSIC